jgi:hypothetical protein
MKKGKDIGPMAFVVIGGIVGASSIIFNLITGTWKFTFFIIAGFALMVYGFVRNREN